MSICETCLIKDGCKFADSGLLMEHCKMFVGVLKTTNFERITASKEKLAEFIYCLTEVYHYYVGEDMGTIMQYANEDANDKNHIELIHGNRDFDELLVWLKRESTDELEK